MTLRPSQRTIATIGAPSLLLAGGVIAGAVVVASAGAVMLGPRVLEMIGALALAAVLVRHRTALLTAVLYVGIVKDQGFLQNLPIDPTLLLSVLLGCVCLHRLLNGKVRMPAPGLILLLVVVGFVLVASLTWTPAAVYGDQKAAKFWTLTLLCALSPFFILEDRADLWRFAGWTAAAAVFAAFGVLVHPPSSQAGQAGRLVLANISGTIFLGRLLLTGAFALLFASVFLPSRGWRLPAAAAGVGLVVVAVGVGSRGPIVAFALTMACVAVVSIVKEPRLLLSLLVVVGISVAVLPFISLPEASVARLQGVVASPNSSLAQDGRHAIYDQAIELIKEHPLLGIGSGGFSIYASVVSRSGFTEMYPHNIFLEFWVELGLVPVLALAIAVLYTLLGLARRLQAGGRETHITTLYLGFFLFNLFSVQFSGDMNDNRTFWTALGVAWLMIRYDLTGEAAPEPAPSRRRLIPAAA